MGGGRQRSSSTARFLHHTPLRHSRASLSRHSCAGRNLRPPPSFLRRQEPARLPPVHHLPPSPIHPSPLLGGRLGGGWEVAIVLHRSLSTPHLTPSLPLPLRHSPSHSVIPAPLSRHSCAGRNPCGRRRAPWLRTPAAAAAAACLGRRHVAAHTGASGRPHSCLRRNDGSGSAGMTEREARVRRRGVGDRRRGAIGVGTTAGARSRPPTPT